MRGQMDHSRWTYYCHDCGHDTEEEDCNTNLMLKVPALLSYPPLVDFAVVLTVDTFRKEYLGVTQRGLVGSGMRGF